jgi:two-component system sensor histidine kinase SenX3
MQIGVIGLLVTCVAQVSYWIAEEATYTQNVRDALLEEFEQHVPAAGRLLEAGVPEAEVSALLSHVVIEGGTPLLDSADLESLDAARDRRLNRYRWEGAFFLVALVASMGIVGQALRQRSELMRRQENFIAAVSHEFKSPLASLKLAAETLLMREPEAESTRRMASRMVDDVERLEAMVGNTLDASRISEGKLRLEASSVELASEVRAVLGQSACRAHIQGVEVKSLVPSGLHALADPIALQTVLRNLVNNAVKSVTLAGGGTVEVLAAQEGRQVRIDVVDDGVGFEGRVSRRLFEKFYRPGDELRRKSKGSGLGLYIVKRFVEQSGGRIAAHSEGPGSGATFSIWLPLGGSERA